MCTYVSGLQSVGSPIEMNHKRQNEVNAANGEPLQESY